MNLLEKYIRLLLTEESTKDDIYGKYLFGEPRGLPEEDLGHERQLGFMITDYLDSNEIDPVFKSSLIKLLELLKQGKYKDVLEPDPGIVYRGLKVNFEVAKKMFGEKFDHNIDEKRKVKIIQNYVYNPVNLISSWSYSKRVAVQFALYTIYNDRPRYEHGDCVILFKTNVGNNNFLFNWNTISDVGQNGKYEYSDNIGSVDFNYMYDEQEAIGVGPIKCEEAIVIPYYSYFKFVTSFKDFARNYFMNEAS
jgi:hypothetical protein